MNKSLPNPMTKGRLIFGWIYLAAQQFLIPLLIVLAAKLLSLPLSELGLNFIYFLLNFVVVVTVFALFLAKDLRHFGKHFWSCIGICLVGFVVYWAANVFFSLWVALFFPNFANANDAAIQTMATENYKLILVSTVILVPIVEETLYRGVIYGTFARRNSVLGYIFSAVLFSAIHVVGYIGQLSPIYLLVSFLQYLPAALTLTWSYAKSGTIFVPILIHTALNLLAAVAMR